jgi:uncharacterized protein YndB with AHSA1/START domain
MGEERLHRSESNDMYRRLPIALAGLLLLGLLAGYLLPERRTTERVIDIAHPPERVWTLLADPHAWNRWSPWLMRDPSMKITYDGAPSGVGARWRWRSASEGEGEMQIIGAVEPRSIDYAVSFAGRGKAVGRFLLEPTERGTRLTWRLQTNAGWNPLDRWALLLMREQAGPDLEQGLRGINRVLARQAGSATG